MRISIFLLVTFVAVGSLAAEPFASDSERIAAMEKVADLALVPPTLNTSPLPEYDYDKLDYGMTIGIERTPKGRLWACWVAWRQPQGVLRPGD